MRVKLWRLFTPYVKWAFKEDKFSPYLTATTGLYLQTVQWTENTIGGNVTQTVNQGYWGIALGIGAQWNTDDAIGVFVDGRYHTAMRGDAGPLSFIDIRGGVALML